MEGNQELESQSDDLMGRGKNARHSMGEKGSNRRTCTRFRSSLP